MATPPAKWLLDTNVLSELRRPRPDQRVTTWIESHLLDDLCISTVTLAEIRFGIETLPDQIRRAELEKWLAGKVRPISRIASSRSRKTSCSGGVCLWKKAGREVTPTPSQT